MKDDLMTTREAARLLGVSHGRVRQLVYRKQLPAVLLGRDNWIRAADVRALLEKRTEPQKRVGRPYKPPPPSPPESNKSER
jgi:excisionase family DNA binding protein